MILTHADDGASVEALLGAPFTVHLDESPTTGYRWQLKVIGDAVSFLDSGFEAKSDIVGGVGQASFNFLSVKQGRATLFFKLSREWESDAAYIDSVTINIVVVVA
ncbi:MAG: protease inhibitor I42 family protein [Alphaproteobacteria bacterium]|nr:protease inhibitor I42 family protein [Alphaproteobacteria bacterium]